MEESSRSTQILIQPSPSNAATATTTATLPPSAVTTPPKRSVEESSFSENRSPPKRQRLAPDMPAESTVVISTPASQKPAGSEEDLQKFGRKQRKKQLERVSLTDNQMENSTENGNGAEANFEIEEEGGLQEKTKKKRKHPRKPKVQYPTVVPSKNAATEEGTQAGGDAPTLAKAEEAKHSSADSGNGHSMGTNGAAQPGSRLSSSDPGKENGNGAPAGINGKRGSEAMEVDSEDEDKDAIIRRAQTTRDAQKESTTTSEASNGVIDTKTHDGAGLPPSGPSGIVGGCGQEDARVVDEGKKKGSRSNVKKQGEEKAASKRKRRDKRKARREAKEQSKKAQLDLPKGGDFSNDEWEGEGEDDDDNMEINLEMDDLESTQEEEQEPQGNDVAAMDGANDEELSKDSATMDTEQTDEGDVGKIEVVVVGSCEEASEESVEAGNGEAQGLQQGMDELTLTLQRKYFIPYQMPKVTNIESRSMFENTHIADFKVNPGEWKNFDENYAVERRCQICFRKGHSEDECPELSCQHCGSSNEHFSHACPDIQGSDDEPKNYEWHRIAPHRLQRAQTPENLPMFCYFCAGSDHYGDECPEISPPTVSGSFSLTEINNGGYVRQDFLLSCNDTLELISGRGGYRHAKYGRGASKYSSTDIFDPFEEYCNSRRQTDNQTAHDPQEDSPHHNRGRDRRGDSNVYRPSYNGTQGRNRSPPPERSSEFDRYRSVHRLRSQSPILDSDRERERYRYRPPQHVEYRQGAPQPGGGYRPPLPNEPVPTGPPGGGRRRDDGRNTYRPMPSAAAKNWSKSRN
ncbi:hypothetical protein RUND412_001863 [Rhizina undulata]